MSSQVVNIDGSKPNVELSIKLAPAAGALAGKVVDGDGKALGGATITVTASGTTVGAAHGDLHYETISADGTGAWRLDGVATPSTYVVRITKDGYASASLIATLDGGDTNLGLDAALKQGVGTVHALVRSGDAGVGALTVKLTSARRWGPPTGALNQCILLSDWVAPSYTVSPSTATRKSTGRSSRIIRPARSMPK